MNSFEWIWQYAKKNKNKLLLAVIFVVINAILIVIIPLLSGRIVYTCWRYYGANDRGYRRYPPFCFLGHL